MVSFESLPSANPKIDEAGVAGVFSAQYQRARWLMSACLSIDLTLNEPSDHYPRRRCLLPFPPV